MSYATVANLRVYLPQVGEGEDADALLGVALDRANAIVNEALGFSFAAYGEAAARDVLCRYPRSVWPVPAHKAGTVSAVALVYGRGTDDEYTVDVTGWLEESDGALYLGVGWSAGTYYRVTAQWGYGPAPDSIVEVELRIARTIVRNRDSSLGQGSIGVEGDGLVDARTISWDERNIIDNVRRQYLGVRHA